MRSFFMFALVLTGCSSQTFKLQFAPLVAGAPFSCSKSYDNIGTSKSTIEPLDFRMYVNSVNLVAKGGSKQPLTLTQDGVWQRDDIALLDFEDGTGTCNTSSPATNFTVTGTAPAGDYDGVEFTVGLPADHDHLAVATAAAPFNEPAMWWSWAGGYRYLKVDVQSTGSSDYLFHLGAEDCTGASMSTIDCKYPYLATISLSGFAPDKNKIALDLATLLSGSDVDMQAGCTSDPSDPQCPAPFAKMGLAFENMGTAPAQTVFTVQ